MSRKILLCLGFVFLAVNSIAIEAHADQDSLSAWERAKANWYASVKATKDALANAAATMASAKDALGNTLGYNALKAHADSLYAKMSNSYDVFADDTSSRDANDAKMAEIRAVRDNQVKAAENAYAAAGASIQTFEADTKTAYIAAKKATADTGSAAKKATADVASAGATVVVGTAAVAAEKAKAAYDKAKSEAQDLIIDASINSLSFGSDFDKISMQKADINEIMRRVEVAYDKSIAGAYMEQKMAKLLSSQAFCDAKNECSKPKDQRTKFSFTDLKEVFPNNTSKSKDASGTKKSGSSTGAQ